jgi:hypothetical protein
MTRRAASQKPSPSAILGSKNQEHSALWLIL